MDRAYQKHSAYLDLRRRNGQNFGLCEKNTFSCEMLNQKAPRIFGELLPLFDLFSVKHRTYKLVAAIFELQREKGTGLFDKF